MGRRSTRIEWLIAISIAVTLGFCAICGSVLWEVRRGASERATQSAINLVSVLQSEIFRTIDLYDLSLQAAVDGMKLPQVVAMEPEIRQLVLFDRAATASYLGPISVLDETGKVILDSTTLAPPPVNLAKQDYFQFHRQFANGGLYLRGPMIDRNGDQVISLSRRRSNPDGSFAGIVLGTIQLSFFQDLFTRTALGPRSAITLLQDDGRMLMRLPFTTDSIGRDIGGSEVFKRVSSVPSGSYEGAATIDGVKRIYAFARVGTLPLILTAGRATDVVYADWRREAFLIGLLMIVLCAATIGLSTTLSREWMRREAAERQLAVLAETDALSGLANRRKFDAALSREWSRASREHTPVSLLMIDADLFKAYNDANGHQAGDILLCALAECIRETAKRSTDIAARYGGEEFAVLLPATPLQGACELATKIHDAIGKLQFTHPVSGTVPTVSIGLASMVPEKGADPNRLLKSADGALYAAKKNGRNRTEIAEPMLDDSPSLVPDAVQGERVS